jgi:hypothetical protein
MRMFRRRLRALARTWVLFQAVSFAAFVAPSCCLGQHGPTSSTSSVGCHDDPVAHCEKAEAGSPPCPMHHAGANAHQHSGAPDAKKQGQECAMRAACGGQAAAFFAALSHVGVLHASIGIPDSFSADAAPSLHAPLIVQFHSPDAPPPRA